jgi:hypothetical protein
VRAGRECPVAERRWEKDDAVEHTEDDDVGSDTEGEREDGGEGEAG